MITAILVSKCSYAPTKYLLLLMSCLYSNSSSEQKLKGLISSQMPLCIDLSIQYDYILSQDNYKENENDQQPNQNCNVNLSPMQLVSLLGQLINYDNIAMKPNLQTYKNLRVYKHLSFLGVLNQIICNRIMKSKLLVEASPSIYKAATKFPGKTITHWIIGNTFNRVFTGGNKIERLEYSTKHLAERGIPIIIDFCAEGTRDHLDSEGFLDQNARQFAESATVAARIPDQLISIKISALINLNLLEKINRSVLLRDSIWREFSKQGKITAQGLFDGIFRIYGGLTTDDVADYIKSIHSFTGEVDEFQVDQLTFKINHHPFYLYEPQKNDNLIVKILMPLDNSERNQLKNMKNRLGLILDKQFQNTNNLRVLADAEQSYIQRAIECICEQLQAKYNHQKAYIITTLQNYLKIAQKRVDFELEHTKRKNLFLAMKLVRGAYIVEESKVSKQNGTEYPIVESFDKTTDNYLKNFQKIIQQKLKGEIFVASHNESAVLTLLGLKSKASPSIRINFAQLFGLGDHLTFMLKDRRENVYKLLPWAETEVVVGYMIRRGQQLSQTNYPLEMQYQLLKNQLRIRILAM